jgi:LemA protein
MGLALFVVLALVLFGILTYNSLTRLRLLANNAWADIDVQLKRRHDLVPTLVSVVKGHAGYEKGTLEAVVAARNRAMQAEGPRAAGDAEQALAGSVRQLFALGEAYPDLKAGESYVSLQKSLSEIEDHIRTHAGTTTRWSATTTPASPSFPRISSPGRWDFGPGSSSA